MVQLAPDQLVLFVLKWCLGSAVVLLAIGPSHWLLWNGLALFQR